MCVHLRTKFQISSIILTSFRVVILPPLYLKQTPKKPIQISFKEFWVVFVLMILMVMNCFCRMVDRRYHILISAGTRDSCHRISPRSHEQDLNLRRTWIQSLPNEFVWYWEPLHHGVVKNCTFVKKLWLTKKAKTTYSKALSNPKIKSIQKHFRNWKKNLKEMLIKLEISSCKAKRF